MALSIFVLPGFESSISDNPSGVSDFVPLTQNIFVSENAGNRFNRPYPLFAILVH